MTDRERLIELIRCASFHPVEGVRATIGSRFTSEFIEDIASHLIANGVTIDSAPRWIPVTERLPENTGDVLVYTNKVAKARYGCDGWHGQGGRWTNVSHWMPLPKPPEDGGAENA